MQDTLDITGAGYKCGFTWLYTLETGSLFYSCTVKGYNTGLQQWHNWQGCKSANLPPGKLNIKTGPSLAYTSVFFRFQ